MANVAQQKAKQTRLHFPFTKISSRNFCIDRKLLAHQNSQVAIFLAHPSSFDLTVRRPIQSKPLKRKKPSKDDDAEETPTSSDETSEKESRIAKDRRPADDEKFVYEKKPVYSKECTEAKVCEKKSEKGDKTDSQYSKSDKPLRLKDLQESSKEYWNLSDDYIATPQYYRRFERPSELEGYSSYYLTETDDLDISSTEELLRYLSEYRRTHPKYFRRSGRHRYDEIPDGIETPSSEELLHSIGDFDRMPLTYLSPTDKGPKRYYDAEWISPYISDNTDWSPRGSLLEDWDMHQPYARKVGDLSYRNLMDVPEWRQTREGVGYIDDVDEITQLERERYQAEVLDKVDSTSFIPHDQLLHRDKKYYQYSTMKSQPVRHEEVAVYPSKHHRPIYSKELEKLLRQGEKIGRTYPRRTECPKIYRSETSLDVYGRRHSICFKDMAGRRRYYKNNIYPSMYDIPQKYRSETHLEYLIDHHKTRPSYTREMDICLKRRDVEGIRHVASKVGRRERHRNDIDPYYLSERQSGERSSLQKCLRQRDRERQRRRKILNYLGYRGRNVSSRRAREMKRRPTYRHMENRGLLKGSVSRGNHRRETEIDYVDERYKIFPQCIQKYPQCFYKYPEYLNERERPRGIYDLDYLDDERRVLSKYSSEMEKCLRQLDLEGKRFPTKVGVPERQRSEAAISYLYKEAQMHPKIERRLFEPDKQRSDTHLHHFREGIETIQHLPSVVRGREKLRTESHLNVLKDGDLLVIRSEIELSNLQERARAGQGELRVHENARGRTGVEDSRYRTEDHGENLVRRRASMEVGHYPNASLGSQVHGRLEMDVGRYPCMVSEPDTRKRIGVDDGSYPIMISEMEDNNYPIRFHETDARRRLGMEDDRYPTMIPGSAACRRHEKGVAEARIDATLHSESLAGAVVNDAPWTRKVAIHDGNHPEHHAGTMISGVDALSSPDTRLGTLRDEAHMDFLSDHSRAHLRLSVERYPSTHASATHLKYPGKIETRPREQQLENIKRLYENKLDVETVVETNKSTFSTGVRRAIPKSTKTSLSSNKAARATITDESMQTVGHKSFEEYWKKLTEYMDEKDNQSSTSGWSVDKLLQRKIGEEALQVYLKAARIGDTFWTNRLLGLVGHLLSVTRKTSTFLNLNVRDVIALLCSDYLDVPHERHVFYAVYSWLEHDPQERLRHANDVLRCVRYGFMSSEELVKCALCSKRLEKVIMAIPEYQEALLKGCAVKKTFHKMLVTSEFKPAKPRIKNDPSIYYNRNLNSPNSGCHCHPVEKRPSCSFSPKDGAKSHQTTTGTRHR